MSKTTHYELNTPIGSEVLSVMTGLNPNFNTIDKTMYDNETRSTQALNKANVNEQNIATSLGRITTAEGDIDTLKTGLQTANTNISGLISRVTTAESGLVSANNRIQENTNQISNINANLSEHYMKIKYITKNITIASGTQVTVNVADDLPTNITRFEVLSASLGGYVLPYFDRNSSAHLNVTDVLQGEKSVRLYNATSSAWTDKKLELVIGYIE